MSRSNIAAILRAHELAKQQKVRRAKTNPDPVVTLVDEDEESYARFSSFAAEWDTNEAPDCKTVTPGLVKVSMAPEPKSIYSPAGTSRISFEKPKKRNGRDPHNVSAFCELPTDRRRDLTLTVEDGSGRARGVIRVNAVSKRIAVSGFGLVERPR